MLLSVIMPVYNERATLEKIVERVQNVPIEKEIIMVDDGSTDGTREILKKLSVQDNISVFLHKKNRGKGAALSTGLKHISGDYVIFQDADLEYHPEEYPRLLEPILRSF